MFVFLRLEVVFGAVFPHSFLPSLPRCLHPSLFLLTLSLLSPWLCLSQRSLDPDQTFPGQLSCHCELYQYGVEPLS